LHYPPYPAENRLLRERLGTKQIRLTDADRIRLAMPGKKLGRQGLAAVATIASPETILRWHRELVAKKHDGSERRGPGRPKKRGEIAELVVRMARENETWGYTRIKGPCRTWFTRSVEARSSGSCESTALTRHRTKGAAAQQLSGTTPCGWAPRVPEQAPECLPLFDLTPPRGTRLHHSQGARRIERYR
jgi:hypothetical protein